MFPFAQATLSRGKSTKQLWEGRTNTRLGGLLLTWKRNQRGVSVHHFQFWVGVTSRKVCFTTHLLRSGTSRRSKTWTSSFCEVHCQAGHTLLSETPCKKKKKVNSIFRIFRIIQLSDFAILAASFVWISGSCGLRVLISRCGNLR